MIPGTTIILGDREWLVPPLSLAQLQHFLPRVQELNAAAAAGPAGLGAEQLAVLVEVVTAAMQRNYPEITTDQVGNLLDLGNAPTVLAATLAAARLTSATEPSA
jgi:hypothetical protein